MPHYNSNEFCEFHPIKYPNDLLSMEYIISNITFWLLQSITGIYYTWKNDFLFERQKKSIYRDKAHVGWVPRHAGYIYSRHI